MASRCSPVWKSPTLLAPMEGVLGHPVRELLASYGSPGLVCAPFLRITAHAPSVQWLCSELRRTRDLPLSMQLLGNHAAHLALAARVLSDAGADVVDLNLGCPVRQIARKGVGSGMLGDLDAIYHVVSAMRAACSTTLSVKIRAGIDNSDNLLSIAKAIEAAGADFLVLHPRTRHEGYSGVADWSLVRRIKSELTIPVVGNGDLWYAADALRLMQSSGADAIMIGRGALRNPFIFRQIEELRQGQVPFVPNGHDIVEHIEQLSATLWVEHERTRSGSTGSLKRERAQSGPIGSIKEHARWVLRAAPASVRLVLWDRAKRSASVSEILEAIRPLRELSTMDLASDGPLRFEMTPANPG